VIATFVIFLREGIEASMIVAILLAYLDKTGQRQHFRAVFAGVGAALVLVLGGGVAAYELLTSYAGSRTQTIFETATYLVATVVLTGMTFWMRNHARTLTGELQARSQAAIDGRARWGLGLLSFQAVGREGLETMVFTLAIVFASSGRGVIVGGVAGLCASLAVAFAIYRLGRRINLARFSSGGSLCSPTPCGARRTCSRRTARSATCSIRSSGTRTTRPCCRSSSTSPMPSWPSVPTSGRGRRGGRIEASSPARKPEPDLESTTGVARAADLGVGAQRPTPSAVVVVHRGGPVGDGRARPFGGQHLGDQGGDVHPRRGPLESDGVARAGMARAGRRV
jgi:hypothetical protein